MLNSILEEETISNTVNSLKSTGIEPLRSNFLEHKEYELNLTTNISNIAVVTKKSHFVELTNNNQPKNTNEIIERFLLSDPNGSLSDRKGRSYIVITQELNNRKREKRKD